VGSLEIPEISYADFLEESGALAERMPLDGTLETTFRCNLRCVHCYVNEPARDRAAQARELSTERLLRLVDEVVAEGCLEVLLTGGEVLLRPDFPEVYLHALRRGLHVTVFTNGTLITERIADLFQDFRPAAVEISLYGMTRETYEKVTRVPGSFDQCMAGIRRLAARGIPFKLKTMVLSWNRHELEAMRGFAAGLGVEFRHDSLLNARVDCGANRNPELQVTAAEAVDADQGDEAARVRNADSFRAALADDAPPNREEVYTCGAGQIGFTVDPYGRLQLCQLSRRSSFDLRDDTFARGWHEFLPGLRARTWQSNSVCRSCSLRPVCGSCPGASELEHGDIEAAVASFCEITHLRAHALVGEVKGHRSDATCCLGHGQGAAALGGALAASSGCGSCAHGAAEEPALLQIQRKRPASASPR
jgi:radical SAM protein with 4Fe4S-binding SPASM domain